MRALRCSCETVTKLRSLFARSPTPDGSRTDGSRTDARDLVRRSLTDARGFQLEQHFSRCGQRKSAATATTATATAATTATATAATATATGGTTTAARAHSVTARAAPVAAR